MEDMEARAHHPIEEHNNKEVAMNNIPTQSLSLQATVQHLEATYLIVVTINKPTNTSPP